MQALRLLINGLIFAIALTAVAGCSNLESATERDFGNSVHAMIQGQLLNPQEALLPDPEPVDHGNGERLNNVLGVYTSDVSSPWGSSATTGSSAAMPAATN
ncbi:MAG: hypothetical protein O6922_07610 [Chloroflexi bacterium]|nr:hypothetical protein [Chloroflexota bacterium]